MRRFASLIALLAFACAMLSPLRARATSDPSLAWSTIETPHFRVHYHSGIEEIAQHVASIVETIHESMVKHVGWRPTTVTEILLIDSTESANGSATALPYNAIRLFVTAPEDMSPLGDVDDWYLELLTHEYTHILQTDNIRGLPAILNAILGKTFAPNQVQPRWILEGLAVYQESARTSGGRLRNSQWEMQLRTDVLENNVASLDQVSNYVRRWPQGNLWYLYGSYFTQWIADTYGEQALRTASAAYGANIIPWGINRSIRRGTGATYEDMYPTWISHLQKRFGAQAAEVRAKGLRQGTRLTHHGQTAAYPRWIPKGAWSEHEGSLLYYREDQHARAGLWALPIQRNEQGRVTRVDEAHADQIARTSGDSYASFTPEGGVIFSSREYYKNVFLFGALQRMAPGEKSPFGLPDGGRSNLVHSRRAADPAVSPDGRRIVFTVNRTGTRSIYLGDLTSDDIVNVRPLVAALPLEQAFTPRWSPDGTHVAYSVWKHGGYRDIRYVDIPSGTYEDLTEDRAVDGGPSFSPDGRFLLFHSDRTGISNLYALELATKRLFQVTNVLTGAYQPELSPDGKTLAYVGYTKEGFDLFAMPFDETRFLPADEYEDDRPPAPKVHERRWPVKPYSAWPTVLPRRYGIQLTPGNFGDAVIVSAAGSDITGFHSVALSSTIEIERPEVQGSLSYTYGRLPFDVGVSVSRSITPRTGYSVGDFKPTVIQENVGVTSSLSFAKPGPFDTRSFAISHTMARVGVGYPLPGEVLNPYDRPDLPSGGLASSVRLAFAYSNAERYLRSVGPERGYLAYATLDVTDPTLGSDFSGFVVNGNFMSYYLMPWLSHHSLAAHLGAGTSGGTYPGRGAFYVGGFVDVPVIETLQNMTLQGALTLRGYEPVVLSGRSYTLANLEYRFPIVNIDRGVSTLPIFLNRINGNVFFDYGSAFDVFTEAQFKSGTGAELWTDWTLGYVASFTFRLGYARGLASGGIDKFYVVAAVPY